MVGRIAQAGAGRWRPMTEAEWLTTTDPEPMLGACRGALTERKARLLSCAICRRLWELLGDRGRPVPDARRRGSSRRHPPPAGPPVRRRRRMLLVRPRT